MFEHLGQRVGGEVKLSSNGTFDTLNPVLYKGNPVAGISSLGAGLVFDSLLKSADDEISSSYGLLAEGVSYPDDISNATFRLRPEAKWADGQPVTPEDVVFSFDKAKELNPLFTSYYSHMTRADRRSFIRSYLAATEWKTSATFSAFWLSGTFLKPK